MKKILKKQTFALLLLLVINIAVIAQPASTLIKVIVAPDHKDWIYKVNETAKFSITVLKDGNPLDNAVIDYEAGPDMLPDQKKEGLVLRNGKTELSGTMKSPGFYRVRVWAVYEGRRYEGLATAGFEPEKIQPTVKEPADFDSFWSAAIADARRLNLDPIITLMPERCTSEANVYHISFQNDARGSRIYGILSTPKQEGKYPAILTVPWAGIRPFSGNPRIAGQGFITLEIGIHGIPVNLDQQVYNNLAAGALSSYWTIRMNDKDSYYYKRAFIGCVKAIDFIFSLPEFDGVNVAVTGSSQGGALSIITAALDKRVKYMVSIHPAMCDATGYLNNRAGGWPHYFSNNEPKPNEVETLAYFDVVNFAKRVQIPIYMSWGFNDITCPPTSMYAAYNVINAPKELKLYLEVGHWTFPEQTEMLNEWPINKLRSR